MARLKIIFGIVLVQLCFCSAPVPTGATFSPVQILEADPDLQRRASGAIAALKSCEAGSKALQASLQELREKLEACGNARIEVERDAGKYDGIKNAVYGALATLAAALLAMLGIKLRKFVSPI